MNLDQLRAELDATRIELEKERLDRYAAQQDRDRDAAELERWRTGLRRHSWPTVQSVPDGIQYAAALVRAQGTEGGEDHDRLLREAAIRMRDLSDAARVLLADRDRVEASRRDWAAEALRLQEKVNQLLGLLDCVHDNDSCRWDHNHSCQTHGFFYLQQGEKCPQHEIGELLAAAERGDLDEHADQLANESAGPQCSVHPEGGESGG